MEVKETRHKKDKVSPKRNVDATKAMNGCKMMLDLVKDKMYLICLKGKVGRVAYPCPHSSIHGCHFKQ
jgi:hypothetical protein